MFASKTCSIYAFVVQQPLGIPSRNLATWCVHASTCHRELNLNCYHQLPRPMRQSLLLSRYMMTSSNGNVFRVTGPLCGEFTGPGEFPAQRPVTRSFGVSFDLRLNKRLSKQSWGWWFETPTGLLWRHRNDNELRSAVVIQIQLSNLKNPRIHLFHTSQCSVQNRNVYISVLSGAL